MFRKLLMLVTIVAVTAVTSIGQEMNGKRISGKVTDHTGLAVPGVTIIIKGTTAGTVTDSDGNYTLELTADAETLVFAFVGMNPEEVVIGNQSVINVVMSEAASDLDEVVVIGYGTQRKATLTGAITSVATEEIRSSPSVNLSNSLYPSDKPHIF